MKKDKKCGHPLLLSMLRIPSLPGHLTLLHQFTHTWMPFCLVTAFSWQIICSVLDSQHSSCSFLFPLMLPVVRLSATPESGPPADVPPAPQSTSPLRASCRVQSAISDDVQPCNLSVCLTTWLPPVGRLHPLLFSLPPVLWSALHPSLQLAGLLLALQKSLHHWHCPLKFCLPHQPTTHPVKRFCHWHQPPARPPEWLWLCFFWHSAVPPEATASTTTLILRDSAYTKPPHKQLWKQLYHPIPHAPANDALSVCTWPVLPVWYHAPETHTSCLSVQSTLHKLVLVHFSPPLSVFTVP